VSTLPVTVPAPAARPAPPPAGGTSHAAIRQLVRNGMAVVILLCGGVGGWAAVTHISGAVIAAGSLVVDSNVKKVQHPSGGIVGEIQARDGDRVKAGQVLVRLDETMVRANLAIVRKNLVELTARKARLEAERDERTDIAFPRELLAATETDPDVASVLAGERKMLELRATARNGQKALLTERTAQLREEIAGHEAQAKGKGEEIVLINRELEGARDLWRKNLMPITKLTALEREATRLTGERAQLLAQMAQAKGKISEIQLQIIQIDREMAGEVGKEMREIEAKVGELVERRTAAEDQMRRIDIRAPLDGVVHQSVVHTVGGVIQAGEALMLVVPGNDTLTAEVRVPPQDIDQLWVGQVALLRFPAFNQRTTPEINGTVERISADVTVEQRTGASYYLVRIGVTRDQVARLGDVRLVPGMPVEAHLKTGDRRVISWLMKPLSDQMMRAFREK
jgi:HlyD family secretion protein